jgi:hypothetical protein
MKPDITDNFERVAGSYDSTEDIFSGPIADRLIQVAGVAPGERVLNEVRDPADGSVTRTAEFGWTVARRPL